MDASARCQPHSGVPALAIEFVDRGTISKASLSHPTRLRLCKVCGEKTMLPVAEKCRV